MDLETSLKGMMSAEEALRSQQGVDNPAYMSKWMARLSTHTSAVEAKLAEYEKDYELTYAKKLSQCMFKENMKVTQAERTVDIETAELKGQIKYLTRLVASAWKQVGVTQSRFNHLVTLASTQV